MREGSIFGRKDDNIFDGKGNFPGKLVIFSGWVVYLFDKIIFFLIGGRNFSRKAVNFLRRGVYLLKNIMFFLMVGGNLFTHRILFKSYFV